MFARYLVCCSALLISVAAADPAPGGIVLFGDSTTALRPGSVEKVVSVRLSESLENSGSTISVHNAGVGGNNTRDAKKRFQNDVLRFRPRLIVMQFGINDAAVDVWKTPPATEARVPLDEYRENLGSLVAAAREGGAKVIFMTPNPLRWTPRLRDMYGKPPYKADAEDGFDAPVLEAYRGAMRDLAATLQIPLVEVPAAWESHLAEKGGMMEDLLLDGMHPNDAGHEVTAMALLPVVIAELR